MTISFREVADRCDAFDEEVAAITEARKEFWAEVRDQLPARDVKALKAAIKLRKRRRADLEGEEDHDQRTAEILLEIERGTDVANISTRGRAPREDAAALVRAFNAWTPPEDMIGITPYIRGVTRTDLPPHDEDGVLIEEETATIANGGAVVAVAAETDHPAGFVAASPINSTCRTEPVFSDGCRPCFAPAPGAGGSSAKGDAGEIPFQDASPTIPESVAVILPDLATVAPDPSPEVRSGAPIPDITAEAVADLQARADVILNQTDDWADLEIPKQFRREKAA